MTPQKEKAGSSGPSLFVDRCGLPSPLPCKAEERSGQIRKVAGRAFVAFRRLQIILACDLRSVSKQAVDHVAHVFVSSVAALAERHPVQQQ